MAKSKRILALDIGTSAIKLAEFTVSAQNELELTAYGTASLGIEPGNESARAQYIISTIGEIMLEQGIKPAPTLVAVPGQSVFSRYVKMPMVEPDKISKIVAYETEQHVPFPMNELVWDYQLLGATDQGDELEVLLVAIKEEIINEISSSVNEARLDTDLVDVAPLAIYNAVNYNYGEMEGCTLVLDIGARSTDLVFIEGERVFNRTIPMAGNNITQQIAKDLDLSFDEAEELKCSKGMVSMGAGYEASDDPETEQASKSIRTAMTRLHADLNRQINFYRGQQGGKAPVRILITGGSVALPYLDTFLSDKLNVELDFLNPFQEVAVGAGIDDEAIANDANVLSEVVGLGLRATPHCGIEVNLMPPEIYKEKQFRKKQPALVLGIALMAVAGGVFAFSQLQAGQKLQQSLTEAEQQVARLSEDKNEVDAAKMAYNEVEEVFDTLRTINQKRKRWPELLNAIASRVPEGMWLTKVTPIHETIDAENARDTDEDEEALENDAEETADTSLPITKIAIEGLGYLDLMGMAPSLTAEAVNQFAIALADADEWFTEETQLVASPAPKSKEFVRSFKIEVALKEPIK